MTKVIPKTQLPMVAYNQANVKDELCFFAVMQDGIVAHYTALDEAVFVPFAEILEYAATAPREKPTEPKLREVRPT